jgi:glycerol-3-phosphate dehydrogenase (NAD(P)+)
MSERPRPTIVGVLGAGSWGTALALHLASLGHEVRLWARDPEFARQIATRGENPTYLPGFRFPDSLVVTDSFPVALDAAEFVVAAVPSHGTRRVLGAAAPYVPDAAIVVSATKGLEGDTLLRGSEVIEQELGSTRPVAVLSGPSFAGEVARKNPTAICVASSDPDAAQAVQHQFRGPALRLYVTDDVAGVEIGGALKNVIAIAAGVTEALGLGPNALAALITRGLAEISRIACAVGGRRETLAGLSGLGDLVLTCTGTMSRNKTVGLELGRGRALPEILGEMKMVAEGVRTTGAALMLGGRYGVETPIAAQMAQVLDGRKDPRTAVQDLMLRPQRAEPEAR